MNDKLKVPAVIVAVIALIAFLFVMGSKAMSTGDLDQGDKKYTPGKPPWEDPLQKGAPPAGSPGAGQAVPPQPSGNPAGAPPGGGPPGMAPPTLGSGH